MLEPLDKVRERLRFDGNGESLRTKLATQNPFGSVMNGDEIRENASKLFACTTCETVYIAIEKQTCPKCDTPVQEVSDTL